MSDALLLPPVSKSDAQRALVLAEFVGRPLETVLESAGNEREWPSDLRVLRDGLVAMRQPSADVDCRDGGAPFRFLLTQAALRPGHVTRFTGTPRLGDRPHGALVEALGRALGPAGLRIEPGTPWPWTVHAPPELPDVSRFDVRGEDTSQAVSSLLLGAALLAKAHGHDVAVHVTGTLASAGYVEVTRTWLQVAGFDVDAREGTFTVSPPSGLPILPRVPGDWSSIAPLLVFAWRTGARVGRIPRSPSRGNAGASLFEAALREVDAAPHPDRAIVPLLESVGLRVQPVGEDVTVTGEPTGGLDVDVAKSPDLSLVLGALACVLPAPSTFRNAGILRAKESDRFEGLVSLVRAGGASVAVDGDAVRVAPANAAVSNGAVTSGAAASGPASGSLVIDAHGDHRRAMAAACLAMLQRRPLHLIGAGTVAKSFPSFWDEVAKVGFHLEAGA